MGNNVLLVLFIISYVYLIVFAVVNFVKLQRRVNRLETVFRQLGPTAEARLQEGGTHVVLPPRWLEDEEEVEHG